MAPVIANPCCLHRRQYDVQAGYGCRNRAGAAFDALKQSPDRNLDDVDCRERPAGRLRTRNAAERPR